MAEFFSEQKKNAHPQGLFRQQQQCGDDANLVRHRRLSYDGHPSYTAMHFD
jgi:hypothetical protein